MPHILLMALLFSFLICLPVLGASDKVSSNTGGGTAIPPTPAHTSEITLDATDAGTAAATRRIKGQGVIKDENIAGDTITLNCGGTTVHTYHGEIVVEEDSESGVVSFPYTPFTMNQTEIATIVPPIGTTAIWCTLNLPQDSITWTYPNAFRLDEVAPNVTTPSYLITDRMVPTAGGTAKWSWLYGDPLTSATDPDGTCGTSACNLTKQLFQYQFYYRAGTGSYPVSITGSAGYQDSTFQDDDVLSTTNRFGKSAISDAYCYTLRVEDTAGNFSGKATDDEKCVIPDGKAPVFQRVQFYKDSTFSQAFLSDAVGKFTVTSNPCYFDPVTCARGPANPRYIYLKLIFDEPLFGQFFGGYPSMANDSFDNDSDGLLDEEGNSFDGLDNDGDGFIDEDVSTSGCAVVPAVANDLVDNDCDGHVDEESINTLDDDGDGLVDEDTWTGKNCGAKELWNQAHGTCVKSPRLKIAGPDLEGQVPYGSGTNNSNDAIQWVCTAWSGNTNALCDGYATGTTIYRYRWEVSGDTGRAGLTEGDYDISIEQGIDGVGNPFITKVPLQGGTVVMDNAPPTATIGYYKNKVFSTGFNTYDHDNDNAAVTPKMPVVPEGDLYMKISMDDYSGATPTLAIYTPDLRSPVYEGEPQDANLVVIPAYTTCGQNTSCDPCTGANCVQFDPATSDKCMVFMACYQVASTTVNNGYAAVTVWTRDRLENMSWDPDNAHAQASQYDADGISDDTNADGYPTYTPASQENDAILTTGQYFAIDTIPPGTPAMGLPITPCDGTIARQGVTCATSVSTTNNPIITWKRLSNGEDDDLDGDTDEETYDFIDNDADGQIDEDALAPSSGTMSWEISAWHLQVSSDPTFATSAEYLYDNKNVNQANVMLTAIPERPASEPYYWRVAAFDLGGNEGPWSPPAPKDYYTFGVDTRPPQITINYFSDAARTIPLVRNASGAPVTRDTTSSPGGKLYVTLTTDEPLDAPPTFKIRQFAAIAVNTTATTPSAGNPTYVFNGEFVVDAIGGGATFSNGLADFLVTTADPYGNSLSDGAPASGTQFYVDTEVPVVTSVTAEPSRASMDNDGDGTPDELVDDAVKIIVRVSEDLAEPVKVKVKQSNYPQTPALDDGVDNDCDGVIDEESQDGIDNDGDGRTDEDTSVAGIAQPGSGCLITMVRDTGTTGYYSGSYNVFAGYDGTASIEVGSTSPTDPGYVADFAGNPALGSGSFTVDTTPPARPTLIMPQHEKKVSLNTPVLGWQILSRTADLSRYHLQLDDSSGFASPIVDIYQPDTENVTTFYYTVPTELALADGKYYWRVYAIDTANNVSDASLTFAFTVDTLPPAPPKFNAVQNPTVKSTSDLSGTTEANATVDIYVNSQYKGSVIAGSDGKFTVGIDDDGDGLVDEDIVDDTDNDLDGAKDEDPKGIFLAEGDNTVQGKVMDVAGNVGSLGCDPATPFYDAGLGTCIITRDSGAPVFQVVYYSDSNLTTPLPFNQNINRYVAKEGTIYLKIVASEDLPNPPTYSINQQGVTDDLNKTSSSIAGSARNFKGSYLVKKANGGGYLDGDAQVEVIGTDDQGNTTPAGTLPTAGAYFYIDTTTSTFKVSYYSDSNLIEPLPLDENLLPNAKAGNIYLLIIANEAQASNPRVTVDQPGSNDIINAQTTAVTVNGATSTVKFTYTYDVNETNGSNYIDGAADVTFEATDLAGNSAVDLTPTQGRQFIVDTTAPSPPAIVLPATTTIYTQMAMTGTAEAYSLVEIYIRGNSHLALDDGVDNDGDGLVDEEPVNSADNDNDMFVDEDTTSHSCTAGKYWDVNAGVCYPAPSQERIPDGSARTTPDGTFSADVTGINIGKNLVYGRATDIAGNVGQLSEPQELLNQAPLNVELTHTFEPGWNLVGIPMQPAIGSANAGLHVSSPIYRLQDGTYHTGSYLDTMKPGYCYWVRFDEQTTVTLIGITSTTRTLYLDKGWNMVSLPYENELAWNNEILVQAPGTQAALGSTDANVLVDPEIYFFSESAEIYGSGMGVDDNVTLQPWIGFVIKAHVDCSLVFPYE